jgi:hypothetical protein
MENFLCYFTGRPPTNRSTQVQRKNKENFLQREYRKQGPEKGLYVYLQASSTFEKFRTPTP